MNRQTNVPDPAQPPSVPDPPQPPAAPSAPAAPAAAPVATTGGPIVFTSDNGKDVAISFDNGMLRLTQEGRTQVIPMRDVVPPGAVQLGWAAVSILAILCVWWPIARAVSGYFRRKAVVTGEAAELERRLQARIETLEHNLDTVAIEMERLSEGQRFTNRLLAERPMAVPVEVPAGVPVAAAPPSTPGSGARP